MLDGLLSSLRAFLRQTIPSLVATLAAAALIAGYNHTFRLTQPRMAALHSMDNEEQAAPAARTTSPASAVPLTKRPTGPVTEYITIHEIGEPERAAEKLPSVDAGKEQTVGKLAVPTPAPRPVTVTARPEPRAVERRVEPRVAVAPVEPPRAAQVPAQVAVMPPAVPPPVIYAQPPQPPVYTQPPVYAQPPVAVAPLPAPAVGGAPVVVAQPPAYEPPPVNAARPSYATVPDRQYPPQYPRPTQEANAEEFPPPPPPQGPLGIIVNTLKPSSIFARMREFGDRIEATGNEILPSIRQ